MKQHARFVSLCTGVAFVLSGVSVRGVAGETRWPFLRHYDREHLARIALSGGVGRGQKRRDGWRTAEEMAMHQRDPEFASTCRSRGER